MRAFVESVGIVAPGLADWDVAGPILAGLAPYQPSALSLPPVELLPSAERRRTGFPVKLALSVGHQALVRAQRPLDGIATIFTASSGDGDVIDEICRTLASSDKQVSPTRFHNSVHNAPSGYWGIATGSMFPSTSLCGYDWSFSIGLLEAAVQLNTECEEVLLIAYDAPYPGPLGKRRGVSVTFGTALLMTRQRTANSIADLDITLLGAAPDQSIMDDPGLENLRQTNPAARALPLLRAFVTKQPQSIFLESGPRQTLLVKVA
ncbi:MAG: beta-ketoacyl synthase chain length factor [Betaproteobacteria bacterium]